MVGGNHTIDIKIIGLILVIFFLKINNKAVLIVPIYLFCPGEEK